MNDLEIAAIHDALYEVYGRPFSAAECLEYAAQLPHNIISEAAEWGYDDTVVGEAMVRFFRDGRLGVESKIQEINRKGSEVLYNA